MEYKIETNKFIRIWIWLWYNDYFRIFVVVFPSYFIILIPLLWQFNLSKELGDTIIGGIYSVGVGAAFVFNDYSNLRRIGMDEYRKKLNDDLE